MNLFTKSCKCGGIIFGPRLGGKARGQWLGYDECLDCRKHQEATRMTINPDVDGDGVRAMRCFTRRSGLLRTTPCFAVVALREPAAIARKAQ